MGDELEQALRGKTLHDVLHAIPISHPIAVEIDRLTEELADSQQECDRLKEELEASDWVGEQACKAIASECIEAIEKQHGVLGLAFTLRQRYGLDG